MQSGDFEKFVESKLRSSRLLCSFLTNIAD